MQCGELEYIGKKNAQRMTPVGYCEGQKATTSGGSRDDCSEGIPLRSRSASSGIYQSSFG
jgi:hypothetical protein